MILFEPAHERARLALRLKPVIAEKAKEKQVEAGGALRQKSDKAEIDTKKELAKLANVSHDTIAKAFSQIWEEPRTKKYGLLVSQKCERKAISQK